MNRPDAINIIDKALEKSEGSLAEGEGTSSSSQTHMGKSAPGEYMHDGGRGAGGVATMGLTTLMEMK